MGSNQQILKVDFDVHQEFNAWFASKDVATSKLLFGKPIAGKAFELCGAIKLFFDLGFRDFIVAIPKSCYPTLVREFYAHLHVNSIGSMCHLFNNENHFNSYIFSVILNIDNASTVSIHTKRGPKDLEDFSALY